MSIELILGRSGSGKTAACLETIKNLSQTEKNIYLIVPDQFSHKSEAALADKVGACFEGEASVITFRRLCDRIFEKSGRARFKVLSPSGKSMLIMRAVYLEKKNLTVYKNSAEKAGFAKKIGSVISELKRYGVGEEELKNTAERISDKNLAAKLSDIEKIYSRYNKLFFDEYADSEEDLYLAAALLTKLDYLTDASIFIDEFSDFLPAHYAMLEVIIKRAKNVKFYMCADREHTAEDGFFRQEAQTLARIKDMCYRFGKDLKLTYLDENKRYKNKADLLAVEKNYPEYRVSPYKGECENISIFESSGIFGELERTCGEIVRLCRDEGLSYKDICVCTGDINTYKKAANLVFNMYDIPYFMSEKEAAIENPMVVALISVLDIFLGGFDYESVFLYLKSGFANITDEECDILENYVLEAGITKKQWLSEEDWSFKRSFLGEEDEALSAAADAVRRKVIAPLVKLREKLGAKNTVRTAMTAVFDFIKENKMDLKIAALADNFKNSGQIFKGNMYIKTYNAVLSVLNQCVVIAGEDKIGIEQMKNMLTAGFENALSALIPQTADEVMLCSVSDSRTADCKVMFLLGTNLGDFAFLGGEEGVISDAERETLAESGIQLAPTQKSKLSDMRVMVYRALSKAEDRVYLSYSLTDFESVALGTSPVCEKVRKILPGIKTYSNLDEGETHEYQYAKKYPAYLNLCVSMSKFAAGDVRSELWQAVYKNLEADADYREKIALANKALNYRNAAVTLPTAITDKLYENGIYTSVSKLERFRSCPFSYFIEYTLKAKERKVLKIGAPDIGSVMHAVLEAFVKECVNAKIDWHTLDEDKVRAMLLNITKQYYGGILRNTSADTKANRYLLRRIENNLTRCAMLVVMHMQRGKFEPVECELKFGDGDRLDAVMIDLTSGKKLKLRGVIDRLDKCETEDGTYYRVVDYKSGSKSFSLGKLFYGLDLQLAVYLYAACREEGAKPAAMLYFKIREPLENADGFLEKSEADSLIESAMRMDGLVLADSEVVAMMDSFDDGKSNVIPVEYTKAGEFAKKSKVATAAEFERIFTQVKKNLKQIGDNIIKGKTDIKPCEFEGDNPCEYCKYSGICRFDKKSGEFERPTKINKEEALIKMEN